MFPFASTENFCTPLSSPLRMVAPDCDTLNNPAVPAALILSAITPTPLPDGDVDTACMPIPLAPEALPLTPVPVALDD
jgi:hypothetical protein